MTTQHKPQDNSKDQQEFLKATDTTASAVRDAGLQDKAASPQSTEKDKAKTKSTRGWEWLTLRNAYEPKPPWEYLVKGILPLPSLTILFGPPGMLKTMLAQDLCLCVASGKPWMEALDGDTGIPSFGCQKAPVLWIDQDNGRERLERRWAALGKGHGISEDAPLYYVTFPNPEFVSSRPRSVKLLTDEAQRVQAKLIVIDNLGRISGGADENSAQMINVMYGLRRLSEDTRSAVIVIHHKTKGEKKRAGNTLRGHSSIEAAVDLALMVDREEGDDSVTLQGTKSRDIPVEPFTVLWTYETQGLELVTGRFFGLGRAELPQSKSEKARQAILDHLSDGMNQSDVVALVKKYAKVGRNTTLSTLNRLVREKKLKTESGPSNSILYYRR